VAARWKRWRIYFKEIRMDPHEDVNLGGVHSWPGELGMKAVKAYLESIKKYPNPGAPNVTRFSGH
jgi:arylsulfatase